jgi:hypothetical protein
MWKPTVLFAVTTFCMGMVATGQENSSAAAGKMMKATGSFDIQMKPAGGGADGKSFPRLTSDKQFHGDLEGTSYGEMLASGPPPSGPKGSGAYVAMEHVTGKLGGRSGSFILQHSSSMNSGVQQQNITVVPNSGTGELAGLEGRMTIRIEGGKHFYDFDYTLGGAQ